METQEEFNVLANCWWNDAGAGLGSPSDEMLHALLGLRDLAEHQREAWRTRFDHYVFRRHGDPLKQLTESVHGTLGAHTEHDRQRVRMILLDALSPQADLRRD